MRGNCEFFRAQNLRNPSPVKYDAPLPVYERVSQIRFELLVKNEMFFSKFSLTLSSILLAFHRFLL